LTAPPANSGGSGVHQSRERVDTAGVNGSVGGGSGSVVLGASPLGRLRAPFNDPTVDFRIRQARLGGALYATACLTVAATAAFLPTRVNVAWLWLTVAAASGVTLALVLAPWQRWPDRAILVPLLGSLALIGVGLGAFAHALVFYLPLYALAFVFVGMTQRPGIATMVAPLAVALGTTALLTGESGFVFVPLLIMVGVSTMVGEVVARFVAMQRIAGDTLDELLMSIAGLTGCQTVAEATDLGSAVVARLVGADFAVVLVPESPGSTRFVYAGSAGADDDDNQARRGEMVVDTATTPSGTGLAAQQRRMIFVQDARSSAAVLHSWVEDNNLASVLYLPLAGRPGAVPGVVIAGFNRPRRPIDAITTRGLNLLAEATGRVVDQLRTSEQLAKDADTDPLTGLANRRVFFRELATLEQGDALVFLDLDHFKDLNDTLGHAAGDLELAGFGVALREQVRQGDTAARYGGEEFAVLVRGHGRPGAELLVQRLRDAWARASSTTFSVGAALHELGTQPNATLAAADRAVYVAKASGRDRMCWSDGPETFGSTVRISSFGVGSRHRRDDDGAAIA